MKNRMVSYTVEKRKATSNAEGKRKAIYQINQGGRESVNAFFIIKNVVRKIMKRRKEQEKNEWLKRVRGTLARGKKIAVLFPGPASRSRAATLRASLRKKNCERKKTQEPELSSTFLGKKVSSEI